MLRKRLWEPSANISPLWMFSSRVWRSILRQQDARFEGVKAHMSTCAESWRLWCVVSTLDTERESLLVRAKTEKRPIPRVEMSRILLAFSDHSARVALL